MTKPTDLDAALAVIETQKWIITCYRSALREILIIADRYDSALRSKIKAVMEEDDE